jgi:N-acetylmuramoyl-L-alanine amidase
MPAFSNLSARRIAILALTMSVCGAAASAQTAPEAGKTVPLAAKIAGDAQRTRFVAFLAKAVDYRIFPIMDPYRLVIDLPETSIQVPSGDGKGLVLSSRAGALTAGQSRIVIDLAEPALVEKAEVLPAENGLPARFVLDLVRTSYKAFAAATKAPPPVETKAADASETKADPKDKRLVIVIDPGHGGVDAGAHGRTSNVAEKEVTLDLSLRLKEQLEKTGRYRVVMTRTDDTFVALDERAEIATKNNAAMLISIHADAVDPKVHGAKGTQEIWGGSIHTLSEQASDELAKQMAIKENSADQNAGLQKAAVVKASTEIDAILNDLENRTKRNRSLAFANFMVDKMRNKIRLNIKPHRYGNLRVLKAANVPAVLMELGYLSNDEDEKLLISKDWRAKTAEHLANAISSFMTERQVQLPQ